MLEDYLCSHQIKSEAFSQKELAVLQNSQVMHTFRGY